MTERYRAFEGYALAEKSGIWIYKIMTEEAITVKEKPKNKMCACGGKLLPLHYVYQYDEEGHKILSGEKCSVCGQNYFSAKTMAFLEEIFILQEKAAEELEKENQFDVLLADMQKDNKGNIEVGFAACNKHLMSLKSKAEQSKNKGTEKVAENISKCLLGVKQIVAWDEEAYAAFMDFMRKEGQVVPEHDLILLKELMAAGLSKKKLEEMDHRMKRSYISKGTASNAMYMRGLLQKLHRAYENMKEKQTSAKGTKSRGCGAFERKREILREVTITEESLRKMQERGLHLLNGSEKNAGSFLGKCLRKSFAPRRKLRWGKYGTLDVKKLDCKERTCPGKRGEREFVWKRIANVSLVLNQSLKCITSQGVTTYQESRKEIKS